jgi:iron complex outermembrane recepter protein
MKKLIAGLAAGAAGAALAQALPPVTVTATRTEAAPFDVPASVDVIDGDRVRGGGRPEINLSEAVGLVPGVVARDRQNYAQDLQLSIRGFGARSTFGVRGVRVYVDGIPATMPDGQGQLSHIDLASAGRIELLRGPFSALYGNSSGGVLQVFTQPGEGPPTVTVGAAVGSYGLLRPEIRASGSTPGLRYTVSASRFSWDGWREHSGASRDLANARLDVDGGAGRQWTIVANAVDIRADDPLGLSRAQFQADPRGVEPAAIAFDTRKTVRQTQVGVVHDLRLTASQQLRVMVYAGERGTTQFQSIPVAPQANPLHPGGVIGLGRGYAGADLRWIWHATLLNAPLELVAGVSYDTLAEHRQGWQNFVGSTLGVQGALRRDEDNHVDNLDPYLQGVWKFAPRWTLTAGVRQSEVRFRSNDHYILGTNGDDSGSVRYRATLPVAALMYALSPQLHAYGSWGRGFETPTLNELAYRPDGTAGLNLALRPSRSSNEEVGLKGRYTLAHDWRSDWSAALFHVGTSDEIVTRTNSGGRSTFQNAGSTRRRGAELEWSASNDAGWLVQFAQTWLDARYSQAFGSCSGTPCLPVTIPSGNRIPGTARSITAAEVAWRPARGWGAGAELRSSSRVFVTDANSDAAPGFTTVALHTGYVFDVSRWKLSATARVDNLFDRRYAGSVIVNEGNARYFEPAPGRNYTLKLTGRYAF